MVAGHLREQNGIYHMILSYKDSNSKRKTKSISTNLPVKGNKKRAEAMLTQARKDFLPTLWDGKTPLCDFLAEWLELTDITPDKYAYYLSILDAHIRPHFENKGICIADTTAGELEAFYQSLKRKTENANSDALSGTWEVCHYIIKTGLAFAVTSGWIAENPADKIDLISGNAEILFSDFIKDWLEVMKNSIEITTYCGYYSGIHTKIAPYFAEKGYTLKDLEENPKHIQDYYQYELTVNKVKANTVIHYHANIRKCLQYAFQMGMIRSNPADRIERPQKNTFVSEVYNEKELEALFRAVKDDPLKIPVLFAAFYGMRRSEVVGLKWSAVDFEQKHFVIKHIVTNVYLDGKSVVVEKDKPKNRASTRTYPLTPPLEKALLDMKRQQEEDMRLYGASYEKRYLGYINRDRMGTRLKPGYVSSHFRQIITELGLKVIRFHDLRHSCASVLYNNGVDMKAIQEWLGHSNITTTANIYTHFDFNKKIESANAMLNALPMLGEDDDEKE
jgi:integrase